MLFTCDGLKRLDEDEKAQLPLNRIGMRCAFRSHTSSSYRIPTFHINLTRAQRVVHLWELSGGWVEKREIRTCLKRGEGSDCVYLIFNLHMK